MTRNDVLAEYVRSRYPDIEKSLDFSLYSFGVALREFGKTCKKALFETVIDTDELEDVEHG